MQRYAFQVAYDGSRYFGFVRQPGQPTVEEELLKVFKRYGLITDPKTAAYQVAARTDRGVSALGQVVALDTLKRPNLNAINSRLPYDICILSAVAVQPSFNPRRHALQKHYHYTCVPPPGFNVRKARGAARMLIGAHDFQNFCKHEKGKSTVGKLERVKISGKKTLKFDFVGPTFLWQQVRRMVGALSAVGGGKLDLESFKRMLEKPQNQLPGPAPTEGLVLVKVKYRDISFEHRKISKKCANLIKWIKAKKSTPH